MPNYEYFFTDEKIISALCKQRMAFCRDAHKKEFFERFLPSEQRAEKPSSILNFMPPRSRWKRVCKQANNSHLQNTNNLKFTVKQLREAFAPEDRSWIAAQNELIESIRIKALAKESVSIEPPKITPIPKDKAKSKYRVIASYSDNLVDSIIIRQCANYLRRKFDKYFLDCSFAFRSPLEGQKPVTHHNAFERLAKFWKANQKDNQIQAYVAECDIQGFYDTIDHEVILSCYDSAVLELKEKHGIHIDDRAKQVILAYLESYTYNNYGRPEALFILEENSASTKVKDRNETLQKFHSPGRKYGVPQGGALSNFFGNLILHKADLAVMKILETQSSDGVYVRYCDDMVIATTDEVITNQTLDAYIETLDKLRLKHHSLESIITYSGEEKRRFWSEKPTKTYFWGNKANVPSAIPWLAFVGYQLGYDGMVRIRPRSIQKELEKQRKIGMEFLRSIKTALEHDRALRYSRRELLASLEGRLRAGAIGKRPALDLSCGLTVSEFGWCKGFNELVSEHLPESQRIAQSQLRCLDRGLGKQLAIAKASLAAHSKLLDSGRNGEKKRRLKHSGKPRSYAGQLKSKSTGDM